MVYKLFLAQYHLTNKMGKERGLLQVYHPKEGTTIRAE